MSGRVVSVLLTFLPKPGKDASLASSYRPISLTSCLCKLFERLIDNRLSEYLNWKSLINADQSGFQRNMSATDPVVRLVQDVCDDWEVRDKTEA